MPEIHYGADLIINALRKAYPGELEREELADETGLNDSEMRDALKDVGKMGQLDEDADQFRWRDPEGGAVGTAEPSEDGTPAELTPAATPANVPGAGTNYRAVISLKIPFQLPLGEESKAVEKGKELAEALGIEIAERFGSALVTLDEVQAFDSPRGIYKRGEPDPETSTPDEEEEANDGGSDD